MGAMVFLCTVPSVEVGSALARQLVEERLAACVNLLPGLRSFYRWEGQLHEDSEALLIIKTQQDRVDALLARLPGLHPYSVPEGIGWAVGSGLEPYLEWVQRETRPPE